MRVLLLSTTTGYQLRSFGDAAADLGIELVFATDRCQTLEDPWRDRAIAVRFYAEPESLAAVVDAHRHRPIHGLIAVGDRPVALAAQVAAAIGLPGHPPAAARASAHKMLARRCFAEAGLPVPWYVAADLGASARELAARVRYPAVVKPVGLSGSRGVMRVNGEAELAAALDRLSALMARADVRAQRAGTERDLIIEGFIPGHEYALEGVMSRGRLQVLAIFDKPDPLDGPFFEETIYVTPCDGAVTPEGEIANAVERAAAALGLYHGPVHAECRVNQDGVFVLEVAARPIGGLCSRVLRFERRDDPDAGTVSLEHVLLRHAVHGDVAEYRRESAAAAVMMIPIPRRGVYRGVRGEAEARAVPHVEDVLISARRDQLIEPLPEASGYLGFIFARARRTRDAQDAVREAHRRLAFAIDGAIAVVPG